MKDGGGLNLLRAAKVRDRRSAVVSAGEEAVHRSPKKVRSSTRPAYRNKIGKYPCGILERAYRELKGTEEVATHPVGAREDQTATREL